jgi:hypothetical protein
MAQHGLGRLQPVRPTDPCGPCVPQLPRRPDRDARPLASLLNRRSVAVPGVPQPWTEFERPRFSVFGLVDRGFPPPESAVVPGRGLRRDEAVGFRSAIQPGPQYLLGLRAEHDDLATGQVRRLVAARLVKPDVAVGEVLAGPDRDDHLRPDASEVLELDHRSDLGRQGGKPSRIKSWQAVFKAPAGIIMSCPLENVERPLHEQSLSPLHPESG